jgi:ubiquinone/menaquinone biosynthesis C-methylase UbiE
VNRLFVTDFLFAALAAGLIEQPAESADEDFSYGGPTFDVLDLGTGTAQIPIELCRRSPRARVMAADQAIAMLDVARLNVEIGSLRERIQLSHIDAKTTPYADGMFAAVMSNSIVHHIPEPRSVLAEAVRVVRTGGLLFFRDLLRPPDKATLDRLVDQYAGDCNEHQRAMFAASLHAALTLDEIRALLVSLGFPPDSVAATSDRHWTWSAIKRTD